MNLRHLPALPHWLIPSRKLRINIIYLWRHGRLPNLNNPRRFTELVQHRKIHDHHPKMSVMADKCAAKNHVAKSIGKDWVIPTYWSGPNLPDEPVWPYPFILKASHGCNQNIVCRHPAEWTKARRQALGWTRRPYGLWLDEWAYRYVPRGYIVEPYLGTDTALPIDYKIYVFGGKAAYVQVHLGRGSDHRWILFTPSWRRVSMFKAPEKPKPPEHLLAMLDNAEKLARPFDFARVDFYEINGVPKFGEMTFYPGSGLDRFNPVDLDMEIGALWLAARGNEQFAKPSTTPEPAWVTS